MKLLDKKLFDSRVKSDKVTAVKAILPDGDHLLAGGQHEFTI